MVRTSPNYGILGGPIDGPERIQVRYQDVEAKGGLVVLHRASQFRGEVVRIEHDNTIILRSKASGTERIFNLTAGAFALNGETINLVRPKAASTAPQRTASGSVAIKTKAHTARASRIYVEGLHDAELLEKVWGDDLRHEGIVVERLNGIDDLQQVVGEFKPDNKARLGVLVDHLVSGSKESRIAATIDSPFVMITGTPYVDVWQAIRPTTLGIKAWPEIPKGQDWKTGICESFGETEPGRLWKKLLASVNSYADLEPPLVGAVESLIDFLTAP